MGTLTEKGILPIGIERDGKWHREFEIRPRLVKDTLEVAREQGLQKLQDDDIFFSLCLTAKQIVRIGDIAPVTVDLLEEMVDSDMAAITNAKETLAARLESFHSADGGRREEPPSAAAERADTAGEKDGPVASEDPAPDVRNS